MFKLSVDASALMRAGRAALDPTAEDQARVREALRIRLGAGAGAGPSPRGADLMRPGLATSARLGLAVGVPVVCIGLAWSLAHRGAVLGASNVVREAAAAAAVSVEPRAVPIAPPETPALSGQLVPPLPSPPTNVYAPAVSGKHRGPARPESDTLSAEVALLGEATLDLNRGQPLAALVAFDEHERQFPAGALAEERVAGRVEALCAVGRTQEAKLDVSRLVAGYPRSPHLKHVLSACGWDAMP